jgi:NhaP-type Na+/H+ or K+/H+ antiporter
MDSLLRLSSSARPRNRLDALTDPATAADTILVITVTCVLGSVVLHGMGARPATLLMPKGTNARR